MLCHGVCCCRVCVNASSTAPILFLNVLNILSIYLQELSVNTPGIVIFMLLNRCAAGALQAGPKAARLLCSPLSAGGGSLASDLAPQPLAMINPEALAAGAWRSLEGNCDIVIVVSDSIAPHIGSGERRHYMRAPPYGSVPLDASVWHRLSPN